MEPPPRSRLTVDLRRSTRGWAPAATLIAAWAQAALGRRAGHAELAVRVVARPASRRLNRQWRGRDAPTNVLSFPVALPGPEMGRGPRPIGDLVLCGALVREEALRDGKPLRAHWAHLVVHGVLHLVGYDHERAADAARMERREVAVLRRLGFANPYRRAPRAALRSR
jgi:probable rRNA maturation factor